MLDLYDFLIIQTWIINYYLTVTNSESIKFIKLALRYFLTLIRSSIHRMICICFHLNLIIQVLFWLVLLPFELYNINTFAALILNDLVSQSYCTTNSGHFEANALHFIGQHRRLTLWQTRESKYPRQDCTTPETETARNNILIVKHYQTATLYSPLHRKSHCTEKKKCYNTVVIVWINESIMH